MKQPLLSILAKAAGMREDRRPNKPDRRAAALGLLMPAPGRAAMAFVATRSPRAP